MEKENLEEQVPPSVEADHEMVMYVQDTADS
jgi:hypothetical protein